MTELTKPMPNPNEITRFLKAVIELDQVFEVRALNVAQQYGAPATLSGYYGADNIDGAAQAICKLNGIARGIYVTPNPVNPALLSRCANRMKRCGRGDSTTANHEILKRNWLLIDLDPQRPAGICATESERTAARDLADHVCATLSAEGCPDPIRLDSGNGAQLMYRVDLPADDGGLCQRVTQALAARFNTGAVHVDESVHNAARIWRLPGTVNTKGDSTADRPHRMASIVSIPDQLQPVPVELLESVGQAVAQNVPPPKDATSQTSSLSKRSLAGWSPELIEELLAGPLAQCEPGARGPYKDGFRWKLARCPFNESHTDSSALFFGKGPGFRCLHNSCKDNDFRALLDKVEGDGGHIPTPQYTFQPAAYYRNAQQFLSVVYDDLLVHHDGRFLRYVGTHYAEMDPAVLRAAQWAWFAEQIVTKSNGDQYSYQPTSGSMNNITDAAKAVCNIPRDFMPPCWLPGYDGATAEEFVPFKNMLLHLPTGATHEHTRNLFTTFTLACEYNPEAIAPGWLAFLQQLWPDDPQSIKTLQLILGYILGGGTHLQKIFLIVGPKRSGKGTIARVLTSLLGPEASCGPTLGGLSTPFGLQTLIGKRLAVVSDARLSSRADQATIAERLLAISGEDSISVPRKYNTDWTGTLPTRFLFLTNELPRLSDSSGAQASRFILLTMRHSFYGREDHGLTDRLLSELPGIANWAIDGWRELQQQGRIESPESSREALEELGDLGSPIASFIRDCCAIGSKYQVERQQLYRAWLFWCDAEGRRHPGTAESFGRDLRAAIPELGTSQPRTDHGRVRVYRGVGLLPDWSAHAGTGIGTGFGTCVDLTFNPTNKSQYELAQVGTGEF